MTREQAIKIIRANALTECRDEATCQMMMDACDMAIQSLNASEWTLCSRKLPDDEDEKMLVCDMYGDMFVANCEYASLGENEWYDEYGQEVHDVVAWQELPNAPEGTLDQYNLLKACGVTAEKLMEAIGKFKKEIAEEIPLQRQLIYAVRDNVVEIKEKSSGKKWEVIEIDKVIDIIKKYVVE